MATNLYEEVDYLTQARERYTEQFKNKEAFDAYVRLVIKQLLEVQEACKDMMQLRSIDTAVGSQLDLIGKIVGQPRTLINYSAFPFFGFDGASGAETFGSATDSTVGGLFRSLYQEEGASNTVDDETYRFILKARIIANTTTATPNAVLEGLQFITGNTNSRLIEQPNAHLTLEIQNNLSDLEKYFLEGLSEQGSILPIPIGVAVEVVYFEEDYFGMAECVGAKGLVGFASGYGAGYGKSYGQATYTADSGIIATLA